jgi:hypothetical protein
MANYCATIRSNYFSVKDEVKFRELMNSCSAEDEIYVFEAEDGSGKFGFGCYGSISGIPVGENEDETEEDLDAFYDALQEVLSEGDAIIITEIGNEKLRYLIGTCTVITSCEIRVFNLGDQSVKLAREMLEDNGFRTRMDY